ncbi:hypothetical protein NDU88_005128 [Pleurodeles waltl]|uniref:Uncharacterized protein n=1 Tax=Pleurodeles waltl TaxID=8319 RepID=A0AAV7PHN1_PLEWA|nr:hypothetical protein NDU88_005128 [Pleurodeles waltl]
MVEDDLAIVPQTTINLESFDQVAVRSTDVSEHVVYSVPRREPPSASLFTVAPFARTASGCFNDTDDAVSGSSSSLSSVRGPRIVSDDWDVKTVDSMLTDLQYYTVYDDEDAYQFRDNHGDMFCYNYYGHHFIHKASSPKSIFNYVQWEHCSTPPQVPRKKQFLYEVYNEIWKLSQQEAAARLGQIDQENLIQALSVVDNGMHTLSDCVYTIDSIVSSAIDIFKSDMSSLYHGQSQTRSIMQLGWTLQTLKAGRVPWQHIRAREIFVSCNLTRQQQLMAKKEATYVMLNIEKLEKLPFTAAEIASAGWLIHGVINLPMSTLQFTSCLKHIPVAVANAKLLSAIPWFVNSCPCTERVTLRLLT